MANTVAKQRSKGDGSIYQRADGRWCGSVEMGFDAKGNRRRKVVTAKTHAEALAKLRKVRRDVETYGAVPTGAGTVETWLARWLTDICAPRVAPRTLDGYRDKVRLINEAIGRVQLDKLTAQHIRAMHKHAASGGRSSTTALHCHRVLKRALTIAQREGLVLRNACSLVDPPEQSATQAAPLTADEARHLLRTVATDPIAGRWLLALLYGVRQGEALGLTWDCVDYAGGKLDLDWQLQRLTWRHGCQDAPCGQRRGVDCPRKHLGIPAGTECRVLEGAWVLTRPKRKKRRVVPMLPVVEAVLRQRQSVAASEPSPYGLVFARPDGRPFDPAKDNAAWHAWLEAAGLPSVRLHEARHTAATLLQSLGVEEATRMAILGHSQATTQRQYAHVDLSLQREALDGLARMLTED